MCIVHLIELSLEFQSQLHFFFMVFGVLSVFFFEFEAELLFLTAFFFQLVLIISHCFNIFFQHFLRVYIVLDFRFEI